MFTACDGGFGTSGPDSFKGPLGKECSDPKLHCRPVVEFEAIDTTLPDLDEKVVNDLSRDQKLLYKYAKAISSGKVDDDLAGQIPGPMNHSRWLTLALRLMILFTRWLNPPKGLVTIVTYILKVYVPSWFTIKSNSKFTANPSNLYKQMRLVVTLPTEIQDIVKPYVQRNGYFAHQDVLLCSMLESSEPEIRARAVAAVKHCRKNPTKPPRRKVLKGMRKFEIPPLQWDAEHWSDIITWDKVKVTEPKILQELSDDDLERALTSPHLFPSFPCHTQSVERAVKLVTEAASKVEGEDKRHGDSVCHGMQKSTRGVCQ